MDRPCDVCGEPFVAQRSTAKYCGEVCKKRAQRAKAKAEGVSAQAAASAKVLAISERTARRPAKGGRRTLCVEDRVAVELGELADTALGQQALLIARRLDERVDTSGSAVATLSRQLSALLAEAASIQAASEPVSDDDGDPIAFLVRRAAERGASA